MDVDTYLILVEKHLRKLMKDQVNEMGTVNFRGGIYSSSLR